MSFIKQLIKLLLTYPRQALSSLSIENIKTLLFALKHEPPKRIFHNISKRFSSTETIDKINIVSEDQSAQSEISIVESSLIADKYICIKGVATSEDQISNIFFSHNNIENKSLAYKDGMFHSVIEVDENKNSTEAILSVEFKNETVGSTPITLQRNNDYHSLSLNLQYQIFREQIAKAPKSTTPLSTEGKSRPKFSIVIPTYNGDLNQFLDCINSIAAQTYKRIELCIYDDASSDVQFKSLIKSFPSKFESLEIKLGFGNENKGIAHATNQAIELSSGDYISFMDQDDMLDPKAFSTIAESISKNQVQPVLIYTDEDHIDQKGIHCDPIFKPGYSPSTLLSSNYINHLTTVLKTHGDKIGWLRPKFDGAQDYDLILRVIEQCKAEEIIHVPQVLYHWRKSDQSIANRPEAKKYVYHSAKLALEDYLNRNNIPARVENGKRIGTYKIDYKLEEQPLVSIIIPFKDQHEVLKTCVESVLKITSYENYELVLMSNNSAQSATLEYCKGLTKKQSNIKFLEHNVPFNYSEINNEAVKKCSGEYLLFLNNDTEVIHEAWLTEMVKLISQESVGVVGAKLLYPNKKIQHAGIVLGMNSNAGYINKMLEDEVYDGYYMGITKNVSAVTGACLLTSRSLFDQLGGFDEKLFKVNFNDVDYCLKIHDHGKEIIYCPDATLIHHESYTRGDDISKERKAEDRFEITNLKNKWQHIFEAGDPFYNPNLSLFHEQLTLNLY